MRAPASLISLTTDWAELLLDEAIGLVLSTIVTSTQ